MKQVIKKNEKKKFYLEIKDKKSRVWCDSLKTINYVFDHISCACKIKDSSGKTYGVRV